MFMNYNERHCWAIFCSLRRAKAAVDEVCQPFCEKAGITPMGMHLLLALYHQGTQSAGALAKTSGMEAANCSALCKKLEAQGLLEKHRSRSDERRVLIRLTDKGRAVVEDFHSRAKSAAPPGPDGAATGKPAPGKASPKKAQPKTSASK